MSTPCPPSPPATGKAPGTPDARALALLKALQAQQAGIPRAVALAWERALFAEALDHPDPHRRIQAFLGEGK